jgi:hypothetical protein
MAVKRVGGNKKPSEIRAHPVTFGIPSSSNEANGGDRAMARPAK